MDRIEALLIDIDGVLVTGWRAIEGAVDAFAELRRRDVPMYFATNTTTRVRESIASALAEAGFDVSASEILTAPVATAAYLRSHHPGERCFVLSSGDVTADLDGVDVTTEMEPADVVVLGGAGLVYTHDQLNHAFNLLVDGAAFVAMHRNLYWRTERGLELDTGAYVDALQAASGVEPVVVGKPAGAFFRAGLEALGVDAGSVAMIGDDIENDVLGAQALGMRGVLVRTGKFREEVLRSSAGHPDFVVDSFADVPALLD